MRHDRLLKLTQIVLLCWYGVARWIILGAFNPVSQAWVKNPLGNVIAVITVAYLSYAVFVKNPERVQWFAATTKFLTVMNIYFLSRMAAVCNTDASLVNLAYLVLDIVILLYFFEMMNKVLNCRPIMINNLSYDDDSKLILA